MAMGKVKAVEVVVEDKKIEYCRPYMNDPKYAGKVELCFGSDRKLAKIRYSPEYFKQLTKADLSRIESRLSSCKLCNQDVTKLLTMLNQMLKKIEREKNIKSKSVVHYHGGQAMFEKLSVLYRPVSGILKMSETELNEAYTPEFLGTILEWVNESFGTELGELLLDLIESGIFIGASTTRYVSPVDKKYCLLYTSPSPRDRG